MTPRAPRAKAPPDPTGEHLLYPVPTLEGELLCLRCGLPINPARPAMVCDPEAIRLSGLRLVTRWPVREAGPTCRLCGGQWSLDPSGCCSRCVSSTAPSTPG